MRIVADRVTRIMRVSGPKTASLRVFNQNYKYEPTLHDDDSDEEWGDADVEEDARWQKYGFEDDWLLFSNAPR